MSEGKDNKEGCYLLCNSPSPLFGQTATKFFRKIFAVPVKGFAECFVGDINIHFNIVNGEKFLDAGLYLCAIGHIAIGDEYIHVMIELIFKVPV